MEYIACVHYGNFRFMRNVIQITICRPKLICPSMTLLCRRTTTEEMQRAYAHGFMAFIVFEKTADADS